MIVSEEAGEHKSTSGNVHHIDRTSDNVMRGGGSVAEVRDSQPNKAKSAARNLL
jgi:hypothetical protein